ncbi:MAG: hypothetical protein EOP35_14690 [Rubrivivax sp.]|nr:MAG: hypothetical protein EOP35_14690 [Rubrivivax sp.]
MSTSDKAPDDAQLPPEHERLLEAVHIASPGDPLGLALASVDTRSRQSMAQQALRWTYVLRSRQRWVRDAKVREQHQAEAAQTLRILGLGPAELRALGEADTLVVRVPFTHEAIYWEGRVFPWEYVLAAATREQRRAAAGGPRPFTVIRELQVQHEVEGAWRPVPREAVVFPAWRDFRVLFVNALPTELCERWTVDAELKNLAASLPPEVPAPRVLNYPSLEELTAELSARPPHLLHFAGMDSHQGLRELGSLLGKASLVEAPESDAPDAPSRVQLIDDLLADSRRVLDGLLLRGTAAPVVRHRQVEAGGVRRRLERGEGAARVGRRDRRDAVAGRAGVRRPRHPRGACGQPPGPGRQRPPARLGGSALRHRALPRAELRRAAQRPAAVPPLRAQLRRT